ncbi:HIT domain-containing protein [Candidatus Pacearchaeota archaeon]|nr:HIT domain-containing protein [Candidatus Pacearchaeota archaeon]
MAFDPSKADEIKEQLIEQVEKLDNPNKEQIKEYIKGLDDPGLEDFLKKNNIKVSESGGLEQAGPEGEGGGEKQDEPPECIFCSIIEGKIPSYKLTENEKSIAILELNPLAKGHSIIIPRGHVTIDKLPKQAMALAQKMAKKIKTKLKPEDVKIETSNFQGHAFINVIPLYKDVPFEKKKAEESELIELQKKLRTQVRAKRGSKSPSSNKTTISKDDKLPQIGFRIP